MACITGFDVTVPRDKVEDHVELGRLFKERCSKFVFQLETGADGYVHFQCRIRLAAALRLSTLIGYKWFPGHISATTKGVHATRNFNYVLKEDSKSAGPWTEADFVDPPVMTRQLRDFKKLELRPWQVKMMGIVKEIDDRRITLVYDEVGNIGKSIFCEYLEYERLAVEVPPFRSMEDIMGCVIELAPARAFIVDMPRGMKKDKMGEFYSGLECIKNGRAWDKRYKYRSIRFDRPQVVVFTNCLPDFSLMSLDRWSIWKTTEDFDLEKFSGGGAAL